ncbi:MAG: hypothetical protein K2R98_12420 [Gemmataceae bacterium]|nr:hypothetical protein [Gemmataceae bacterium]
MASADRLPDDKDRRLADALGTAFPPTPAGLEGRVKGLVRRRRKQRRAAMGLAAATVVGIASFALWEIAGRTSSNPVPVVVAPTQPDPANQLTGLDAQVLFGGVNLPPVCPSQSNDFAVLGSLKGTK